MPEIPLEPQDNRPRSLTSSAASYASARAELAAIEAGEFATYAKKAGLRGAIAGVLGLVGYLVLLIGLSFALGNLLNPALSGTAFAQFGGAGIVAVGLGLLHLIIAAVLLLTCTKAPADGFFTYTREELKRDKQWLDSQ